MKKTSYSIRSYCRIKNHRAFKNDQLIFEANAQMSKEDFLKELYKFLEVQYPKFHKMDGLSKLAFLAAEILLKEEKEKNIALVFSNRASSLETDRNFQKTISNSEEFFPSPAVFVYTLPNICVGEISIKHQLLSENSFFIFDAFDGEHLHLYAQDLLQKNKADKVLAGWVEYDQDLADAFLYLVEKEGQLPHQPHVINTLFKSL